MKKAVKKSLKYIPNSLISTAYNRLIHPPNENLHFLFRNKEIKYAPGVRVNLVPGDRM
jgi:hypothetical protein